MQAEAVRDLAMRHARQTVAMSATMADSARQEPIARAEREAAAFVRKDQMRNAWRGK